MDIHEKMVGYYFRFMNAFLRIFIYDWLPANHYLAKVDYDLWAKDVILQNRLWQFLREAQKSGLVYLQSCPVPTPDEKVFYIHQCGPQSAWKLIKWGERQRNIAAPNGYRLATHEEVCGFSRAQPMIGGYLGIGSYVPVSCGRAVVKVNLDGYTEYCYIQDRVFAQYNGRKILFVAR